MLGALLFFLKFGIYGSIHTPLQIKCATLFLTIQLHHLVLMVHSNTNVELAQIYLCIGHTKYCRTDFNALITTLNLVKKPKTTSHARSVVFLKQHSLDHTLATEKSSLKLLLSRDRKNK